MKSYYSDEYEGPENSKDEQSILESLLSLSQPRFGDNAMVVDEADTKKKKTKRRKRKLHRWQEREREQEKWIDDQIRGNHNLSNEQNNETFVGEAPASLTVPLLQFQKEWLGWALNREDSNFHGGILADEMKMGKTLQAIALVLTKRGLESSLPSSDENGKDPSSNCSTALPQIKSTLVVCPTDHSTHWMNEIKNSTIKGSVKVLVYAGSKRNKTISQFSDSDFVITTYSTIEDDCKIAGMVLRYYKLYKADNTKMEVGGNPGRSIFHSVKWERIVLDEGHKIKDRSSYISRCIRSLESSYRWVLSDTPVKNGADELYTLICFLKSNPYSYYFCKRCNCEQPKIIGTRNCECNHKSHDHFSWWNEYVAKPMRRRGNNPECGNRAMILLHHKVLKDIMLRRTKKGRASDVFPTKTVFIRWDALDTEEEDYYKAKKNENEINGSIPGENLISRTSRLQKVVDHPYIVEFSEINALKSDGAATNNSSTDKSATTLEGFKFSSILHRIQLDQFQTSTKLEALREEIRFMIERDGSAKGIVFSQFNTFLDLIKYTLEKSRVKLVQLKGGMSNAVVKQFNEDADCKILLTEYKTRNASLNLTVASHVFLMDPCWNFSMEDRAQARLHRIGQYKPIRVVRFLIKDTIEEYIFKQQEKKKSKIAGIIGESQDFHGLTEEEVKNLFATTWGHDMFP